MFYIDMIKRWLKTFMASDHSVYVVNISLLLLFITLREQIQHFSSTSDTLSPRKCNLTCKQNVSLSTERNMNKETRDLSTICSNEINM